MLRPWALAAALAAACSSSSTRSPRAAVAPAARPAEPVVVATAPPVATVAPAPALSDPFAALLDEHARALVAAAAPRLGSLTSPTRTAVMLRVVWQTVAWEPVSRVEAMAFLLPDGRLRWGVLGTTRAAGALEVSTGLAYPEGALAEGVGRPLGDDGCAIPLLPLADAATLPEVARVDAFTAGYQLVASCRITREAAGAAWVVSFDWFGVVLTAGGQHTFLHAPARVEAGALALGPPTVTALAHGERLPLVDAAGAPVCEDGPTCLALSEIAQLTGETALWSTAANRACDAGRGLACIHLARRAEGLAPGAADALPRRAFAAFRAACDAGEAVECAYLGIAHETGQGTKRDERAAVKAYARGCDGGAALACFNLGGMTLEGRGVKASKREARAHYQRACDLGDEGGCASVDATR